MVFCNNTNKPVGFFKSRHNPYFNKWFSAISLQDFNCKDNESHNPYFNRWFSAMKIK